MAFRSFCLPMMAGLFAVAVGITGTVQAAYVETIGDYDVYNARVDLAAGDYIDWASSHVTVVTGSGGYASGESNGGIGFALAIDGNAPEQQLATGTLATYPSLVASSSDRHTTYLSQRLKLVLDLDQPVAGLGFDFRSDSTLPLSAGNPWLRAYDSEGNEIFERGLPYAIGESGFVGIRHSSDLAEIARIEVSTATIPYTGGSILLDLEVNRVDLVTSESTSPIPEPSAHVAILSLGLLAFGLSVGARGRRRDPPSAR